MRAYRSSTVLSHGPIEELSPAVWRVEGSLPDMPLRRVMTVVRQEDGDPRRIGVSHLEVIDQRPAEILRELADRLAGPT